MRVFLPFFSIRNATTIMELHVRAVYYNTDRGPTSFRKYKHILLLHYIIYDNKPTTIITIFFYNNEFIKILIFVNFKYT